MTTTTLDGPVGARPRVSAIFTDISDSKRLEQLHLRAERLEAVAELSSSLAHEIKNPLASIRSSVEQLARSSRTNPDEKFLAGLIVRESDRLSRLLSEFLDFSRVRVTEVPAAGSSRRSPRRPSAWCGSIRTANADVKITLEGHRHRDGRRRGPAAPRRLEPAAERCAGGRSQAAAGRRADRSLAAAWSSRAAPASTIPVSLRVTDNGPGIPDELRAPSVRAVRHRTRRAAPASASPSCSAPLRRTADWSSWTPHAGRGTTFNDLLPRRPPEGGSCMSRPANAPSILDRR